MPVIKKYLKSKPQVKVMFEVTAQEAQKAQSISLLSEHSNWQPIELKKFKNGKFKVEVSFSTKEEARLQFIYKVISAEGEEHMLLPIGADDYCDNGMGDGGENAVLVIPKK